MKLLEKLPSQYSDQSIPLIAVAKNRTGDKSEANKIWGDFLDKLESHGERAFVELARSAQEKMVPVDEFRELSLAPGQKRVWGLALLEFSKFADDKDWKQELTKINYDRTFPHNFIERMLK